MFFFKFFCVHPASASLPDSALPRAQAPSNTYLCSLRLDLGLEHRFIARVVFDHQFHFAGKVTAVI